MVSFPDINLPHSLHSTRTYFLLLDSWSDWSRVTCFLGSKEFLLTQHPLPGKPLTECRADSTERSALGAGVREARAENAREGASVTMTLWALCLYLPGFQIKRVF